MVHEQLLIAGRWILAICLGLLLSTVCADAAPYTKLIVFGSIWEDMGNNWDSRRHPESSLYMQGRRTNGQNYTEHLAEKLRVSALQPSIDGGMNYAWGTFAERTSDIDKTLQMQIDDFEEDLGDDPADPEALYIVNGHQDHGPDSVIVAIRRLAALGAVYFVTLQKVEPIMLIGGPNTVYDESSTGMDRIGAWSLAAGDYNTGIGNAVGKVRTQEGLNIVLISARAWGSKASSEEGILLNIESAPGNANPNDYFNVFGWATGWSYSVPSERAHEILADLVSEEVNRKPVVIEEIEDLTLSNLDDPVSINLLSKFIDPDADRISYTAVVAPDSILQATVTGATLTVTPVSDGSARITITVEDGISRGLTYWFVVEILSSPGTISLVAESLNFGEVEVKKVGTVTIAINNTGEGPLNVTDIQSDVAGLAPSETEFTIPVGGSHDVTLTYIPNSEGEISGTLSILSDDTENGTLTLPISASAVTIPADPRADFNSDGKLSLTDFILFAQAFNSTNPTFDLNDNGKVDLGDFLIFAQAFSRPLL
jgi:hypothetical protein